MSKTTFRPADRVRRADWALLNLFGPAGEAAAPAGHADASVDILAAARAEAGSLLAAARAETEALREAARLEGWDQGLAAGRDEVRDLLREARDVLDEAWRQRRRIVSEALPEAVELALALARRVLLRELRSSPEEVVALARVLIESAPQGPIEVLAHPDDAAYLAGRRDELGADVEVQADAALRPGDLVVQTVAGTIEATLAGRIERLEAAARGVAGHDC